MFWSERSDSIAAIFIRVNLATRSNETERKNSQNACHHALSRKTREPQVPGYGPAHRGQAVRKLNQPLELVFLATSDVILVINILPTARGIMPDCLQSCAGGRADGDVLPG